MECTVISNVQGSPRYSSGVGCKERIDLAQSSLPLPASYLIERKVLSLELFVFFAHPNLQLINLCLILFLIYCVVLLNLNKLNNMSSPM